MKEQWDDLMEEVKRNEDHMIFLKQLSSKKHAFYLFYNRYTKDMSFAIDLEKSKRPKTPLPDCKGFSLTWGTLPTKGSANPTLVLTCKGIQHMDYFLKVAEDLKKWSERFDKEEEMITRVIGRIASWQNFFRKDGTNGFPENKQKGLYGELLTLELLFQELPLLDAVNAWTGPSGAPQDFRCNSYHIETKFNARKDPEAIRIHGARQLYPSEGRKLYLHVISVTCSENIGQTVLEAEGHITKLLTSDMEALDKFHSKLLAYGYPLGGFESPLRFVVEKERFYKVDEAFPRYPEKEGIEKLEYDILLTAIERFRISTEEFIEVLKADTHLV